MQKIRIWSVVIAVVGFIFLLVACKTETKIAVPTQNTAESSVLATDGALADSDMRYFTLEDFASIVIGESTYLDVSNITGSYSSLYAMSPGAVCEYPMQNGKYIRIAYMGEDLIVKDIRVADPILRLEAAPHNGIGFEDYAQYISFLQNAADARPLSDIYTSKEIKTYIQDIRDKKIPIMIPCYKGEPIVLEVAADAPISRTVYIRYYLFAGSGFATVVNGDVISIYISVLPDEAAKMAEEMSCSELIAALDPSEPNTDNYNAQHYTAVFEDTAPIGGEQRTMLVQRNTYDMEHTIFVLDGCMIDIYAPIGTVAKDWLKDFSIESV